ncbi:hypothetical protein HY416_00010 [Candidatus Kaiserbacteria bacterium]|nr:hypothetical protein [Candidatus Kaiserbacteria bacterium]
MTTKQLEKAIEKVRLLSRERQVAAASALELIAHPDDALTSSEIKGVKQARASVHAGRYADNRAVTAFFRRFSV